MEPQSPYFSKKIHPEDQLVLDNITSPRKWDSKTFNSIIKAVGTLGGGISIPARNRPDEINTDSLAPVVNQLVGITTKEGIEVARPLFVDTRNQKLVFSNDITRGTNKSVVSTIQEPEFLRRRDFAFIGEFHTHPMSDLSYYTAHGFSDIDYLTFLEDRRPQISMLAYGPTEKLLLLKTSVTPNNVSSEKVSKDLNRIKEEFFGKKVSTIPAAMKLIADMNRMVCVEFGLTLYKSTQGYDFKRINVTD